MPTIHYEKEDHLVSITMEGDDDLNIGVINQDLRNRLLEYREDEDAWCCVISASGQRAFSAGADLNSLGDGHSNFESFWEEQPSSIFTLDCPKPLIAAINGHCIGAGLMLALLCDIRIAADHATFAMPEVRYGFPPSTGCVRLARALPLGPAMEMLLTGNRIDAQQAYQWGLISKLVPIADLQEQAWILGRRIADNPPLAVRASKELGMRALELTEEQALRLGATLAHITRQSDDAQEGPRAFRERRRPTFKGR